MGVAILHRLPGRLRVLVDELRDQPVLAYRLSLKLNTVQGIQRSECNPQTGRVLIVYDDTTISPERITSLVDGWVRSVGSLENARETVAATIETEVAMGVRPATSQPATRNPYFVPSVASTGLLATLALKRVLVGRTGIASSWPAFWAASGVSVIAGYPVLRRGAEGLIRNRRVTPDLVIGLATLSMAALRENLVALSVMTALNLVMYQRYSMLKEPENTSLTQSLNHYSERMSRIGMWLAPLSLLVTRSPLRAIGVLLAANPRPAILSHKYRWAAAEQEAVNENLLLPKSGSLPLLASARRIVFSDENILMSKQQEWQVYPVQEGADPAKAVATAASLLQKVDPHPWREALIQRAREEHKSLHTPFKVESSLDGVRGYIKDQETLLGTIGFITTFGVDDTPVALLERRLRRQGYRAQVLVSEGKIMAVIGCKETIDPHWEGVLHEWQGQGYLVQALQDSQEPTVLEPVTKEQLWSDLDARSTAILIGQSRLPAHPHLISLAEQDLARLGDTLEFCRTKAHLAEQDLTVSKIWNAVGLGLALAVPLSAPLIGLAGDVVGMYLIGAQHWRQQLGRKWRELQLYLKTLRSKQDQRVSLTDGSNTLAGGPRFPGAQPTTLQEPASFRASWHSFEVSEVLAKLQTAEQGLMAAEVRVRQKNFGSNVLSVPQVPSRWRLFLAQFKELSTVILMGTAGLSFVMGEYVSGLSMLGILIVNALISTWQEHKSTEIIETLKVNDDEHTRVLRDNREQPISVKEVVPGDVVLLEPGDKVPADVRILHSWGLEVNEATLTGESNPAEKEAANLDEATPLAERTNMLFMGTTVTRGRCTGVVVSTGQATQIGALDKLLHRENEEPTYLQKRIAEISKRFVLGAFVAASVVTVAGLLRGIPPMQMLISAVTLAASAIPEGLPLTITVALTAGVLVMSKRGAVIKKLANLESLGRVNVICSDKTGTLTRNEMTVKELATLNHRVRVSGDGYVTTGGFSVLNDSPTSQNSPVEAQHLTGINQVLTIGMMCNNAHLSENGTEYTGDPTEIALLAAARKAGLRLEAWKRHREIPFDSNTRSMSVVCEEDETANVVCEDAPSWRKCTVFTKGAPEELLTKCTHYFLDGAVYPINEQVLETIREEHLRMAEKALRVLAFAYRDLDEDEDPMEATDEALIYAGMMGLLDPPKQGVQESIAEARRLGIKPVMITGDHPLTARSIAVELGIFQPGDRILTGTEIEQLSLEQLNQLVAQTSVFARVSPEHKLKIVEAFQRRGDVVAMTGDGVNDAPAMRRADVGIAMGLAGSDIAKGTAGIVLVQDHFHSIVEGVKGGRSIIGNVRKAMGCLLAGNLAEVLVTAVSLIVGLPMPLIPLQILLMNVLTDAIPAMVLATGPQETVPQEPYKEIIDKDLYRAVLIRGAILGLGAVAIFATALGAGVPLPVARTMTYGSVVVGQLIELAAWRQYGESRRVDFRKDKVLAVSTLASLGALAATIYVPPLRAVFATTPLGLRHWGMVVAMAGGLAGLSQVLIDRPGRWFRPLTWPFPPGPTVRLKQAV